ncbi:MAG: DUF2891 domain-containing protein [Gemmatimonadaceae bacterium]|nr:DUF2891 domain-containing protein [Gemmatimonadaceae bacterium]
MLPTLTPAFASKFAALALSHVTREYPNRLEHVLTGAHDLRSPQALHPVFYGSYDWHSCVHAYWLLARLLRTVPDLDAAPQVRALFDTQLTPEHIAGEVAYLAPPQRATFERPYGWAWLHMLAAELSLHESGEGQRWAAVLRPLADAVTDRWLAFLPRSTYPIRVGTHYNTAFAIALSLAHAERAGDDVLATALRDAAIRWYGTDEGCQAWEPGGDEFLSPALMEAECMRRVLPARAFAAWLVRFLPRIATGQPATLFTPALVSDRTDGKIAHLDGLNLSRAWCWRHLAATMAADDPRRPVVLDAARRHIAASLEHVAGDYMGEHWLATFALLALDE